MITKTPILVKVIRCMANSLLEIELLMIEKECKYSSQDVDSWNMR